MEIGPGGQPPEAPRTVPDLVDVWVGRTPEAIAVEGEPGRLSYGELARESRRLARRLRAAGARPGQVVAVLAPRSPALVVALLGVQRMGAAYLALDPEAPPARWAEELAEVDVSIVVVDRPGAADALTGVGVVVLDDPFEAGAASQDLEEDAAGEPPRSPETLAYVSYTSGSTGRAKPVGVPHRAVSRLVVAPDWARFRPTDVFLQTAPAGFDASVLEIWGCLANGGRLVIPPAGALQIDRLAALVDEAGVTVLWLTAGLFQQIAFQHCDRLGGLRHLISGGDVVSPAAVARVLTAWPRLTVTNGYGPTENTTFTTCATLSIEDTDGALPIGTPISGTRVAVLDADMRPVPPGVVGELYAGGAGLARGYLGRPAATAERFLPDPTAAVPGERLYRTGDLVRWGDDGRLYFTGRADRQVKLNGYRVEPGEIEASLLAHPEVRAAVVVPQSGPGGTRLVAYLIPQPGGQTGPRLGQHLRRWLRERLPPAFVPAWIEVLAELPLTRNGKIDRSALPDPDRLPRAALNEYVAPRTHEEQLMCELWADALRIEEVGVEDDFFELGGHSLTAAELLIAVQQELGLEIPARTLYLRPTVAELLSTGPQEDS